MKQYSRNIIFTHTPLTKSYRYGDYFQIYPMNLPNAPGHPRAKLFPCLIEFWIETDKIEYKNIFDLKEIDKKMSEMAVLTNKIIEITNLLSCLTNFRFHYNRNPDFYWTIPVPVEDMKDANIESSELSIDMYYYPTMAQELKINEFTTQNFEQIDLVERRRYYFYDPIESSEKEIDFPDCINEAIERYLRLDEKEKIVVNSSIYQLCNAIDLRLSMKSLSFLSAVSSIETLVTYEFKGDKVTYECNDCKSLKTSQRACKKCGKPIWGMAANFREFLLKYVSSKEGANKFYNEVYSIRSKIAHTEYLINNENFLNWEFTDKTRELNHRHIETIQLGKRSLSSWLLNHINTGK